ncbi:MAG TPA: ORF6N domain-containing protein [bacterium]|nr:ORF6N domain-containing protein [bacterium]
MESIIVPVENLILSLRGQRVLLDADLALMYDVSTKGLNQAVKRNRERFPADFMFQLTAKEAIAMRSQSVTASKRNIGANPYAFTEQGVAMLSSVLRSRRAIHVNIAIMRAFVKMRMVLANHKTLSEKLAELERKVTGHNADIAALIDAIRQLMAVPDKPARKIGFK